MGFGTLVSPHVLGLSNWVGMVIGDLICGDGTLGFSKLVISSSCIDSEPFGSSLIVIGSSEWILIISMI
jgi:hypothetical protein